MILIYNFYIIIFFIMGCCTTVKLKSGLDINNNSYNNQFKEIIRLSDIDDKMQIIGED